MFSLNNAGMKNFALKKDRWYRNPWKMFSDKGYGCSVIGVSEFMRSTLYIGCLDDNASYRVDSSSFGKSRHHFIVGVTHVENFLGSFVGGIEVARGGFVPAIQTTVGVKIPFRNDLGIVGVDHQVGVGHAEGEQ